MAATPGMSYKYYLCISILRNSLAWLPPSLFRQSRQFVIMLSCNTPMTLHKVILCPVPLRILSAKLSCFMAVLNVAHQMNFTKPVNSSAVFIAQLQLNDNPTASITIVYYIDRTTRTREAGDASVAISVLRYRCRHRFTFPLPRHFLQ